MKNKILFVAVIALFAIPFLVLGTVSANIQSENVVDAQSIVGNVFSKIQNTFDSYSLPELDGIYDVPNRPDWKLRVIVHYQRPLRPERSSQILVCGLTDPDSSALVGRTGWRLPEGTWIYTLNTSSVPSSVGSSNLATMASDAFSRWSSATGASNKVVFVKSSVNTIKNRASLDGKNIIAWGSAPSNALGVTYTWYQPSTGFAVETDTIMNKKFSWSWSNPLTWTSPLTTCANSNAYDAQNILTHELGHWLGLSDMYSATIYQNATMYGYGSKAEIKKDTLSAGDVLGVRAIYPD